MIDSLQKRKFTAELRRSSPGGNGATVASLAVVDDALQAQRHREIMDALTSIREQLASGVPAVAVATRAEAASSAAPASAPAKDQLVASDSEQLQSELRALHGAITQTKREIAALREMGKPPAHLATATDELDAVVHATESATECILAASERIDELVTGLRNQASAEEMPSIDEIGEQVTRIFESCNFQDITGQRITKVVNTLKFVEERVEKMIQVLGGDHAFAEVEQVQEVEEKAPDDESHLLCGPQLDKHKISQDDIDAFFN